MFPELVPQTAVVHFEAVSAVEAASLELAPQMAVVRSEAVSAVPAVLVDTLRSTPLPVLPVLPAPVPQWEIAPGSGTSVPMLASLELPLTSSLVLLA